MNAEIFELEKFFLGPVIQPQSLIPQSSARLLNHPISAAQDALWDRKSYLLRGSEIDDQVELRRLLDGEISRLGADQDNSTLTRNNSFTSAGYRSRFPAAY